MIFRLLFLIIWQEGCYCQALNGEKKNSKVPFQMFQMLRHLHSRTFSANPYTQPLCDLGGIFAAPLLIAFPSAA